MFDLPLENVGAKILILFGVLLGALIVGAFSYLRHSWTTPPHTSFPYPLLDGLIALAVLGILVITLWPSSGLGGTRVHLLPLSDFWAEDHYRTSLMPGILAAIANFLLFMPLSFLVGIRWPSFDRWSAVLALGIGLSLGIETLQFSLRRARQQLRRCLLECTRCCVRTRPPEDSATQEPTGLIC